MAELARAIIVMGVSGAGKTTLGKAVAEALGYDFIEADELHPAANLAKMSAGVPLDDRDREPWLADVARALERAAEAGGGVAACSALKRRYRDQFRSRVGQRLALVHPVGSRLEIERRLGSRAGHFMPPSLLESQFEALEPPGPDEPCVMVDACLSTPAQAALAIAGLKRLPLA